MRLHSLFLFAAYLTLTACHKNISACSNQSPPMSHLEREQLAGPVKQVETALYVAQPYDAIYRAPVKDQFWHYPGKWSIENADTSDTYAQQKSALYDRHGNLVRRSVQGSLSHWRKVSTYKNDSLCKKTVREKWVLRGDAPDPHMSKPKEKTAHTTVQHLNRQQIRLYRESSELVTTTLFELDSHGRFRQATTTARQDDKKHADKVEYIITKEDGRNRPLKEQVIYGDGATQIIRYRYFGLDHHGNPSRRYKEIWGHFGPEKGPPTQLINRELAVYSYTYFNTAANTEVQ